MAKNEDGEFELILGNRQLISVFLIVVILLGVFFSMGYIVGRNSAPTGGESREAKTSVARSAQPSDSPPAQGEPAKSPESSTPAAEPAAPAQSTGGTHVAKDVPEAPAPEPAAKTPQKEKPRPVADRPTPPPPTAGEPGTGEYWQVVATARPDAEIISEALAKKGFHAILAPAPKEGVFRVLVGPFKDAGTQAQTRTALEAAGFKNPIARKY